MTTHDIELPPLPPLYIAPSVEPVDYPKVAQALMDYARAAIEADRKRRGEPVAWRYTDARGHFRYRGYVADFDKFYPMLKPEPLYAAPQPAEPVTHNDCDLSGQFERSDIENHRLRRAMQKIMARLTELLDEDQFATIEGIATDAGVEPPAEPVKDGTPLGKALDGINSYFASKKADEPVKVPSDKDILTVWADTPKADSRSGDAIAFARAILAHYGQVAHQGGSNET